jgi:hypothetical protein
VIEWFAAQTMTGDLSCACNKEWLIKPFNGLFDHTADHQDQDDAFGFHLVGWSMKQRLVVVMMRLKGSQHKK